jgi:hypothetical protein
MIERMILNGEAYRSAGHLPAGMGDRVRELAHHPIWNHLPDGFMLVVSTLNMTPSTWLTTDVDHLPILSPSATGTPPNEKANPPAARDRRAASALVDLYVSHYNSVLSPDEADQLVALAGDVPEQAAERLSTLFRPYMCGAHVEVSEVRDALPDKHSDQTRDILDALPSTGAPESFDATYPTNMNPTLQYDGSHWRIEIPQSLCVEIRAFGPADERSVTLHEPLGIFLVEGRRVIQYIANESRDHAVIGTGRTVYTDWTDQIPEPPSVHQKTFQTAVTAQRPLRTASSLFRTDAVILIIGVFAIIAFLVILLTVIAVQL